MTNDHYSQAEGEPHSATLTSKTAVDNTYQDLSASNKLRTGEHYITIYTNKAYSPAVALYPPLIPPANLSLEDNYYETMAFLERFRRLSIHHYENKDLIVEEMRRRSSELGMQVMPFYVDFESIVKITPAVALIIASEFNCARHCGATEAKAVNFRRWDIGVRTILRLIGFLNITEVDRDGDTYFKTKGWKIIRFRSGSEADGEEVGKLLQDFEVDELYNRPEIYDGIMEALVNIRQHAYPNEYSFLLPHKTNWWLTGFANLKEKRIRIIALDRGATIPYTINRRAPIAPEDMLRRDAQGIYLHNNSMMHDGQLIAAAVQEGRSSTGKRYRGKGLQSMIAVSSSCRDAQFSIYSRCGRYVNKSGITQIDHCGTPFDGTLVSWTLSF